MTLCLLCAVDDTLAQSATENKKPTLEVASLDSETKKWLDQMDRLASGRTPTAQTWAETSSQLQTTLAEFIDRAEKDGGYVVVGQLKVPGKIDPRSVASPCEILPGGYFVTRVLKKGSSVPFALHSCAPVNVETTGDSLVENVGIITMKSLPRPKTVPVTGSIVLEEHQNVPKHAQIQIEWQIVTPPTNGTMENHQQEISREEFLPSPVVTKVERDGTFKALGLSPGLYHVVVSAPGCQRVAHYIDLSEASGLHEIDPIELGIVKTFTNSIGMEFVWIPPGKFVMGRCTRFGAPDHFVIITKGFWMGKTEVTRREFAKLMGHLPKTYNNETEENPVKGQSIDRMREFVHKLNTDESLVYRFPTEAEWEYACRAGTTTLRFCSLSANLREYSFYRWRGLSDMGYSTNPVGELSANPWGLHDIYGNLYEICEDDWSPTYDFSNIPRVNPLARGESEFKVVRGGGHMIDPATIYSAMRRGPTSRGVKWNNDKVNLIAEVGYRLVCLPQE